MTSSLRNSVQRPAHKERSQLAHRSKFGLLEKHADYVKRARDYHSKQDRLKRLRQKAAERNKDEFYFSMNKEKTRGGVHVKDRGNVSLPTDIVKVLKTQDENYIRTVRMVNLKKIDNLKKRLMELVDIVKGTTQEDDEDALDSKELQTLQEAGILSTVSNGGRKSGHVVFVEDEQEARQLAKSINTSPARKQEETIPPFKPVDLGWKVPNKEKKKEKKPVSHESVDHDMDHDDIDEQQLEEQSTPSDRSRIRLLKEISARLVRDRQLRYAQRELEMQRLMMGKGARKKISSVEKLEADEDDEEDEDEIDARKGRQPKSTRKVDETTYKPRVYKWKLERKR
ncbi:u3 small nucleolar RNA-associated protein 11 [Amanita muscaria]